MGVSLRHDTNKVMKSHMRYNTTPTITTKLVYFSIFLYIYLSLSRAFYLIVFLPSSLYLSFYPLVLT